MNDQPNGFREIWHTSLLLYDVLPGGELQAFIECVQDALGQARPGPDAPKTRYAAAPGSRTPSASACGARPYGSRRSQYRPGTTTCPASWPPPRWSRSVTASLFSSPRICASALSAVAARTR